jgi:hypothetical protein
MIFRQEFNSRRQEIEHYFIFLQKAENDFSLITNYQRTSTYPIDDELLKILKANGFLILYNLVEATILNCIASIFDEIKLDNLPYSGVSENIKKYWSKHIYKFDEKISERKLLRDKFYGIVEIIISNVAIEISDRLEYGGSIDAKIMRKIAEELGINLSNEHYEENLHGKVLIDIKKKRNDLAHGKKSFSDIAKDITYNGEIITRDDGEILIQSFGLVHFKDYTIEHLEKFINSVEVYIENKQYRIVV